MSNQVKFMPGVCIFLFISKSQYSEQESVVVANIPKAYRKGNVRGIARGGNTINMMSSTRLTTSTPYKEGVLVENAQGVDPDDFRQFQYGDPLFGYQFSTTTDKRGRAFVQNLGWTTEQLDVIQAKWCGIPANQAYLKGLDEKESVTVEIPFTKEELQKASGNKIKAWAEEFKVTGDSVLELRIGLATMLA
jgi:hypothetical protein